MTLLHVGVGVCFAGSGALALAAARCPRPPAAVRVPAPVLHVGPVCEVPPGAGALETACVYVGNETSGEVTYAYCPAEFRVTPHVLWGDGAVRCWHCPEGDS